MYILKKEKKNHYFFSIYITLYFNVLSTVLTEISKDRFLILINIYIPRTYTKKPLKIIT